MTTVESRAAPAKIRALLAEGAYVDGIDGQANWPLKVAALSGHAAVVRQLLDGGTDVNKASTKNGNTPLFVAAHQGNLMALQCLLDN